MKRFFLVSIITLYGVSLFGQGFHVPTDYSLVKAEDYAVYEQDVINGINWLTNTPIDQYTEERKEVNAFLLRWMTGSPTVRIEIRQDVVTFLPSPDLLMAFLAGWTKYSLETRDFSNSLQGNIAGIETVIFVYNNNKDFFGKNREVEKYIELRSKGILEQEIAKRIGE